MVQEMTQFSAHPLSYDNPYLNFKSETSLPWQDQGYPQTAFDDPCPGAFDDGMPRETTPQPPAPAAGKKRSSRRSGAKGGGYKHVPHREKPPHLVARRNARERRRVQAVNTAFSRLRKCVPAENKSKRLSKVKTLHRAIEYIQMLQEMLDETGGEEQMGGTTGDHHHHLLGGSTGPDLNKENELHQRWLQLPTSWGDEDDDEQNSCLSFYDDFGDAI